MAVVYSGARCPHCGALLLATGPKELGVSVLPSTPSADFPVQKECPYCGKPVYVPSEDFVLSIAASPTFVKFLKWAVIGIIVALVAFVIFREVKK